MMMNIVIGLMKFRLKSYFNLTLLMIHFLWFYTNINIHFKDSKTNKFRYKVHMLHHKIYCIAVQRRQLTHGSA